MSSSPELNGPMRLAQVLANKSTHWKAKIGCVVVRANRIISMGFNKEKTHPKSPNAWKHIHAEFDAIVGIHSSKLQGSVVYVYRQYKDGSMALARPCLSCYNMLSYLGCKAIVYTTNKGIQKEYL